MIKLIYPAWRIGNPHGSMVVPQQAKLVSFQEGFTAGDFKGTLQETKTGRFLPPEELLVDGQEYFVNEE